MNEEYLKSLQDYVATANSGKYNSWDEINSKFPEFKDLDPKVLQDYVATANSGKYNSWDEINSKFPEFSVKKKEKIQPQEEVSTSVSQTPAQPSTESGASVEQVNFDTLPTFDVSRDERLSQAPKIEDLNKYEDYVTRKEIFSYTPEKLDEANKEIDNEINSLKEQFEFIREQDNELNEYAKRINQSILPIQGAGSEQVRERIRKQILDYETRFANLTEQDEAAKNKYNELIQRKSILQEKTALDEFNKKAEQGNWFGGLYNSLLYGVGEMSAGITNDVIDIMVELMPEEMYGGVTKDEAKKQVKENLLPYVRKGTKELAGTEGTTDEYMQRVSEKNIFTEGIYGLARSAPAMVSPYMSGMYFQVKDGIRQEMELTPELNELNEWEKQAVQTPIALAGMFLERFGFSKLAKSTKAATIVTKEALSSLPQNATKKQIVDAISTTAQKTGAKLASGFAAEAETGALQEISDVGIKEIYNQIKGKDLFSTPETVKEFETNVFRAGLAEGVGGFGMAIPTAVSTFMSKGSLGKVTNNEQYELVEQIMSDPDALNAKKEQLKAQLDSGKLTEEQYNTEINNIDAARQIISEIDETLPTEKRREAFDLITEKKKIQGELAELETKDPDLVAGKIEEKTKKLEEIGVKLQELSQTQESKDTTEQKETQQKQDTDAIQEQTTDEGVLRQEQPEVGLQEVVEEDQKQEGVTEEGKPQEEVEKINVGDTVNATVEVYESGKKKSKRFKVEVTSVNEDGTFDLKRGKLIYKNIKPEKISKIKSPRAKSITQETEGLTEQERVKQGVEELVTSLKEKSREKINAVTNKFKSVINEQRKKLKDFKDRKATITSFAKDLLKGLSKSGVKYIPTSKIQGIINSIDQAKTDESLYNAAQKLIEQVNKIAVTDEEVKRRKRVVSAKNKVKKMAKRAGFGKFSPMIQNAFRLDEDAMSDSEIKEIEDLMIKISEGDFNNISEIANRISELSDKYTNESIIKEEKVETASDKAKKAKEKTSVIANLYGKKAKAPDGVSVTAEEKSIIDTLNSITQEELDGMSLDELKALSKIIDRINQGVIEKDSQKFKERVLKRREAKKLEKAFDRVNLENLFKRFILAPMKAFWGKNITAIDSSFSGHIDSFFGLKGSEISKFLNNFEKKYSDYQFEMKEARAFLNKLYGGISKYRQKRRIADTKIMMYAIQKQFEENPNSKIVHSLKEFYEATMGSEALYNEYERQVGTDAAKIAKELYDKYSKTDITADNIWTDMSPQERKAYTSMRNRLESTVDRVVKIKSLDRGEVMQMINHYFSYPTLKQEELTGEQALEQMQNGVISTRAGVSKSRQSKVSKINFSASRSFLNAIDQVSKDFNLGEALRVELGALKELKESFKNDPDKAAIINEFVDNIRERRSLLFDSGFNETSKILNEIQAATYRYLLGTARRALVETATNLTRVVLRGAFMGQLGRSGLKNAMFVTKNSDKVNELIKTQGSDQKNRMLEGEEMAGYGDEFVSIGEDNYDLDFRDRNLDSRVAAGLRILAKPTRKMGTAFIQSPDKFFSRMLFTLQFMRTFKSETGQDLDFSKLSNKSYNEKYRQALDNARFEADQEVSDWFSSTNRAQKPLNQLRAAKGGMLNRLKYFMISFMINEGQALQKAIINKGAKGAIQKGIPMFTGMAMYQALNEAALLGFTKLLSTLFGEDDEDYDVFEKVLEDKAIQRGLLGAYAELFILRHFNGVGRLPMNFILEAFNKRFGDKFGLREKDSEYDKYNSLVYNKVDLNGDIESVDVVGILAPELTPIASAVESGLKAYSIEPEKEKSKKKREEKEEKELYYTFKAYLTGAAAMGILPKDIRDSYVFYRNRELMFNGDSKKKKSNSTYKPITLKSN